MTLVVGSNPAAQSEPAIETSPSTQKSNNEVDVGEEGIGVMLRHVPIPMREHGYKAFDSQLIQSAKELDTFLDDIAQQQSWNHKTEFLSALRREDIDFNSRSLLLLRNSEGSGSVSTWLETPRLVNDELTFKVNRNQPRWGTSDVAYYCFAVVVPRRLAKTVRVQGANTTSRYFVDDVGNRTLRRGHSNDLVFALQLASPSKKSEPEMLEDSVPY